MKEKSASRNGLPHHTVGRILGLALFCLVSLRAFGSELPSDTEASKAKVQTQQDLASGFNATLRAFRGVAAIDWPTAMELMASDKVKKSWKKENGALFASPIHSEAFFSHSILLFSGEDTDQFTGGIYNLWTDQWMLVDFVWLPDEREYQISAISWVLCHDKGGDLSAIGEASLLETRLQKRLANAVAVGHAAAKRGAATVDGNRVKTAREAGKRIRTYAATMRGALAPDGAKAQRPLRAAILAQLETATAPALPVFFTEKKDRSVVVFADPQAPLELFFATYQLDGKKMVLTEASEWNLSPKGGLP